TDNDDPLKKLIALLESGQTPNVSDSDGDEGETSGVIDSANAAELDAPDGSESVGDRAPVKDATANIIKAVYPAVVKIEDAAIRKEVQDALLGAFYKETQDNYGKVLGAVTKKAAQNVNDSANGGEIDLDAQQSAYDNLNPHKKKA
ncbi:MAG: hypothetical protein LBN43_00035, partial [Oscillospiraceae bacterium]|nr:hypothetical protein [Oscillospiraceae bacterium]